MKAVVQRVLEASVTVDGQRVSEMGPGLLVLLGVGKGDTDADLAWAKALYERACEALRKRGLTVGTGIFGADMKVALVNDGPVTILLESPPKPGAPAA
ncbi:MAG: hypothetical protein EOO71_29985 [Myxococcaceae bacterium]|nr:MAG: hypothetical protein EOO71_29985 [Myxococcaceae bacterium]